MNGDRLLKPAGLDTDTFLRDYWQQRPLLIRSGLSRERLSCIAPDELAGLACEDSVESRLIIRHDGTDWEVVNGPLDEQAFSALPADDWTLLVQDVDKYLPDVAALLDDFRFLPDWRIDDIMISYAEDNGGVGPHTDAYDVFLVQAEGRRRWRLSERRYTRDDLIPGLDIRILADFETDHDWVLEAGDVLYLPPHLAHWGTAVGSCMTWSVGFRSPDVRDVASNWFDYLVDSLPGSPLPDEPLAAHVGNAELTVSRLEGLRRTLRELPGPDDAEFHDWYARYLTEPKPQFAACSPEVPVSHPDLRAHLEAGGRLERHPASRVALARRNGGLALFCQGQQFVFDPAQPGIATYLASHQDLALAGLAAAPSRINWNGLLALVNAGCWELARDDDA